MSIPICSICTDDLLTQENEVSRPISSTNCGHVFHTECIKEAISFNSNCPICRTTVGKISQVYHSIGDDDGRGIPKKEVKEKDELESLKQEVQEYKEKTKTVQLELGEGRKLLESLKQELEKKTKALEDQQQRFKRLLKVLQQQISLMVDNVVEGVSEKSVLDLYTPTSPEALLLFDPDDRRGRWEGRNFASKEPASNSVKHDIMEPSTQSFSSPSSSYLPKPTTINYEHTCRCTIQCEHWNCGCKRRRQVCHSDCGCTRSGLCLNPMGNVFLQTAGDE